MAKTVVYVTVRDEGWAVMRERGERATRIYPTQREAIAHAKELVAAGGDGHVTVQGKDGKFRVV